MLNCNQDIKMLATIKATTVENKENLDTLKKELGLFSQHLKRIDQPRAKSPESSGPGYDQEVLNSVRDNLSSLQEEQENMAKKNKEDIARLLDSLDEKQVCLSVGRSVGQSLNKTLILLYAVDVRPVKIPL